MRKSGIIISLSGPINAETNILQLVGNRLKIPGAGDSNPTFKHRCFSDRLHQTSVPNFHLCDPDSAFCTGPFQKARISYLHDVSALYKQQCRQYTFFGVLTLNYRNFNLKLEIHLQQA